MGMSIRRLDAFIHGNRTHHFALPVKSNMPGRVVLTSPTVAGEESDGAF